MDAKQRMIGVDKASLDHQVLEKRRAADAQKQEDMAYASFVGYCDKQIRQQQQSVDETKRMVNKQMEQFRLTEQGKETRREWDLNRPDAKVVDTPARIGDDDYRCGPASLQRFEGEDLLAATRTARQADESKDWWTYQQKEMQATRSAEREDKQTYAELIRLQDTVQLEAAAEEHLVRQAANRQTLELNARLAAERAERVAEQRAREDAEKAQEIAATLSSPLMTEDPSTAQSTLSPYRVRKDHWKGMSPEQLGAIEAERLQQLQERKAATQREAAERAADARGHMLTVRQMDEQVRKVEAFKRQQAAAAAETLKRQMADKAARDASTTRLYANEIRPEYFAQFGTSHR